MRFVLGKCPLAYYNYYRRGLLKSGKLRGSGSIMKILVPVDGSESSDKAVRYALSLVKGEEDEILILNAQPLYNGFGLSTNSFARQEQLEQMRALQQKSSKKVLDHSLEILKSAQVTVRTVVRNGDPGY